MFQAGCVNTELLICSDLTRRIYNPQIPKSGEFSRTPPLREPLPCLSTLDWIICLPRLEIPGITSSCHAALAFTSPECTRA